MLAHRVKIAGDGQDVKTLNEGVVQDEHGSGHPPHDCRIPEQHLTNVGDIKHFRVAQTELPFLIISLIDIGALGMAYQVMSEV